MKKVQLVFRNPFLCFFLFSTFYFLATPAQSQSGAWAWMRGSSTANAPAVYGTLGVPDANNTPTSLYEPAEWTDKQGNFWLYGGMTSNFDAMGSLWKFDPVTTEWTWINGLQSCCQNGSYGTLGVSDPANHPGARKWAAATWTDTSGNLWLFGGYGYDAAGFYSDLNDLWKYNIATNEWTWMSGSNMANSPGSYGTQGIASSSNQPPARHEIAGRWIDNQNNLWFLGGVEFGYYDDMWKYDITTNEWTWMKGTTLIDQFPVYGTQGIPSATNWPGSRGTYNNWVDSSGNFWFFGGVKYDDYNDLWRFDPSTLEFTWISGTDLLNDAGNYPSYCTPDVNAVPGCRYECRANWIDANQRLWIFGGTNGSGIDYYNDLWFYNIATGEWTWVSGSSSGSPTGVYGTQGVVDPANHPCGRAGSVGWLDNNCQLWMFGGTIFSGTGYFNDLWKFIPDSSCGGCLLFQSAVAFNASDTELCEKFCIDFFDASTNNPVAWLWQFQGGIPATSTAQNPVNICYQTPGIYDVTLITTNASGNDTLTLPGFVTVNSTPPFPVITQNGYTLTSSAASTYQWQFNSVDIPGATNQSYDALQSGYYSVFITDQNGCVSSATTYVLIEGIDDLISNADISIYPNPSNRNFIVEVNTEVSGDLEIEVYNTLGQKVFPSENSITTTANNLRSEVELSDFVAGIYFLEIKTDHDFFRKKIMIVK